MSTRRITKWDRPEGRKEISDRLPSVPGGGANRCEWHRSGKPLWWSGAFFETGCPECQAKLAAGVSSGEEGRGRASTNNKPGRDTMKTKELTKSGDDETCNARED